MPLLCLAFLGTRNVAQRINDSIFARSDFLGCSTVHLDSRASPFRDQMDILRVEKDRAGDEEAVCGSKGRLGAEVETRA